jgi:hypothetical protein
MPSIKRCMHLVTAGFGEVTMSLHILATSNLPGMNHKM